MPLNIKFEVESKLLTERLDKKSYQKQMLTVVERIMEHAVKRSRLNAPILEGDLRESIQYEKPRIVASTVISAIGSNLPYALRWHEEEFDLGPISSLQPSTPEGGVGNKYITRAINHRRKLYTRVAKDAFMKILETGKDPKIRIPNR